MVAALLNISQNKNQHPAAAYSADANQTGALDCLDNSNQLGLPLSPPLLPPLTATPVDSVVAPVPLDKAQFEPYWHYTLEGNVLFAMAVDIPNPNQPNRCLLCDIEPYMSYNKK